MKCDLHGLAANIKATIDPRRGDMRYMVDAMVEHIEKLEACFPKSADGEPLYPGRTAYYITGSKWDVISIDRGMVYAKCKCHGDSWIFQSEHLFSTKDAALAAKAKSESRATAQPSPLLDDERPQQNEPAAAPQTG